MLVSSSAFKALGFRGLGSRNRGLEFGVGKECFLCVWTVAVLLLKLFFITFDVVLMYCCC